MTLDEKAKDLRSSGYTLTLVGGVGIAVMILMMTGIIPIKLNGVMGVVSQAVMGLLFLLFLVLGIRALIKARTVSEDAERETDKREEIERWFLDNFDRDTIENEANPDKDDNDLYFDRVDVIRSKISERFIEIEDSLMSQIIEDIYTDLFD